MRNWYRNYKEKWKPKTVEFDNYFAYDGFNYWNRYFARVMTDRNWHVHIYDSCPREIYIICKGTSVCRQKRFWKKLGIARHERNSQSCCTPASWHHDEFESHFTLTSSVDDPPYRQYAFIISTRIKGGGGDLRGGKGGGKIKSKEPSQRVWSADGNRTRDEESKNIRGKPCTYKRQV